MPGIVSTSSGNVSKACEGKRGRASYLPARTSGNTSRPRPCTTERAGATWAMSPPRWAALPVPARSDGKPCSKVRHRGSQLNALEASDGRKPTQRNLQLSCAVSHFTALRTSHLFTGRSLHASKPPSPGISAMTCAINERASRQAPKTGEPQQVATLMLQDLPIPPNSTSPRFHQQGRSGHKDPNGSGRKDPNGSGRKDPSPFIRDAHRVPPPAPSQQS